MKNLKQLNHIWYIGSVLGLSLVMLQALGWLPLNLIVFGFLLVGAILFAYKKTTLSIYLFLFLSSFWEFVVSPPQIPFSLRPYQFLFLSLALAIIIRVIKNKEKLRTFFKITKTDYLLIIPAFIGILSGLIYSPSIVQSLKFTTIYLSLIFIYIFLKTFLSAKKQHLIDSLNTLIIASIVISGWGILESIMLKFTAIFAPPTTFLGRPDSVLFEPDWLGFYNLFIICLIFLLFWISQSISDVKVKSTLSNKLLNFVLFLNIFCAIVSLTRTVWLCFFFVLLVIGLFWLYVKIFKTPKISSSIILYPVKSAVVFILVSTVIIQSFSLTGNQLKDRVLSIFGQEKITIAISPTKHEEYWINKENIDDYQNAGFEIVQKYRKDINVEIRTQKQATDIEIIKIRPLFGGGFGYQQILTNDKNTSMNVITEILIAVGFIGIIPYLIYVFKFLSIYLYLLQTKKNVLGLLWIFVAFSCLLIPNLLNNGFYVVFCWIWLAIINAWINQLLPIQKSL